MEHEFSQRLQVALDMNRMRAIDLANKTGWTKSTISQYLSGRNIPRNDRLLKLSEILHVSPGWLMGYEIQVGNDELMEIYNNLSLTGKQKVLEYAEMVYTMERAHDVQG